MHTITTSERQSFSIFYVYFATCTLILGRCVCSMCPSCCVHMGVCVCMGVSGLLVCSPKPWRSSARWLHFSCVQVWSTNSCTSTLISCHSRWEYIVYTRPNPSHTHTNISFSISYAHTLKLIILKPMNDFRVGGEKVKDQPVVCGRSPMVSVAGWKCILWDLDELSNEFIGNHFIVVFLILESKMSDMLLKFKWPAPPVFLNLTAWIWMEWQPPSDSCLIFMRGGDLMNYPNVCTDLYLRLSNQETNCSVMRGIHVGSRWALNVILGSIPARPF